MKIFLAKCTRFLDYLQQGMYFDFNKAFLNNVLSRKLENKALVNPHGRTD